MQDGPVVLGEELPGTLVEGELGRTGAGLQPVASRLQSVASSDQDADGPGDPGHLADPTQVGTEVGVQVLVSPQETDGGPEYRDELGL